MKRTSTLRWMALCITCAAMIFVSVITSKPTFAHPEMFCSNVVLNRQILLDSYQLVNWRGGINGRGKIDYAAILLPGMELIELSNITTDYKGAWSATWYVNDIDRNTYSDLWLFVRAGTKQTKCRVGTIQVGFPFE